MDEKKGLEKEEVHKLEEIFEQTDIAGIKQVREALREAEKKKYPDKGILLRSRLPKKHWDELQFVINYLHDLHYIDKPTIYNFVKYSCELVIEQVNTMITKNNQKPRIP